MVTMTVPLADVDLNGHHAACSLGQRPTGRDALNELCSGIDQPVRRNRWAVTGLRSQLACRPHRLDDSVAPDFARTADIHRKPGYDPVELFLAPKIKFPKLKIGWRLLQKRLGHRMLMDVIPLDATLVKGSHGRRPSNRADYPLLITPDPTLLPNSLIEATDVYHLLKRHMLK